VHYQLTLGEKFLKGHRLPWEQLYLDTRVFDERHGLWVTDPRLELIVLVVRQAMKLRLRDAVAGALGQSFFRGGMLREFRWLAERVDPEGVCTLAARLVGERAAGLFGAMLAAGRPSTAQLRALRRLADPAFREYGLYDAAGAAVRGWARELGHVVWRLGRVFQGAPPRSTRTLPHGGVTIAVLGADGAGKSTLVGVLTRWLSREVAVTTTYGGSGVGSASLPRRLLQRVGKLRRRLRGRKTDGQDGRDGRARPVSARPLTTARPRAGAPRARRAPCQEPRDGGPLRPHRAEPVPGDERRAAPHGLARQRVRLAALGRRARAPGVPPLRARAAGPRDQAPRAARGRAAAQAGDAAGAGTAGRPADPRPALARHHARRGP